MISLAQLINEHPEWADLPLAVYRDDGTLHYLGGSGLVYTQKDDHTLVLVMAPN